MALLHGPRDVTWPGIWLTVQPAALAMLTAWQLVRRARQAMWHRNGGLSLHAQVPMQKVPKHTCSGATMQAANEARKKSKGSVRQCRLLPRFHKVHGLIAVEF